MIRELFVQLSNLLTWVVVVAPWEQALRIRWGKTATLLKGGVYLRVPFIDRIYRQSIRKRTSYVRAMTLTTADGKIISIAGCIIYHIIDMRRLYDTLQHPEDVIEAEVATRISTMVAQRNLDECTPDKVVSAITEKIDLRKYGMSSGEFFVTDFIVFPRTIRLVNGDMARYCRGASFDTDSFVQPTSNVPR